MSGPTIWVVSPLYFDTEPYLLLQERVLNVLREWGKAGAVHFVAVDDSGGRDPEMDRVRAQSDTTVVEAPFNLGHQRALVYGLRKITDQMGDDDFVVTRDADGEDRPEDIVQYHRPGALPSGPLFAAHTFGQVEPGRWLNTSQRAALHELRERFRFSEVATGRYGLAVVLLVERPGAPQD